MALKKSELYSSLWQSCDELRGGMDDSHYKDFRLLTKRCAAPLRQLTDEMETLAGKVAGHLERMDINP